MNAIFVLPEGHTDLQAKVDRLLAEQRLAEGEVSGTSTFLDTFDWRIWNDGGVLEWIEITGDDPCLAWRDLADGGIRARYLAASMPRQVADITFAPLRARLALILDMRALMPLAPLAYVRRDFIQRGAQGAPVLRASIEQYSRADHQLERRLVITGVRGHFDAAESLARRCEQLGLTMGGSALLAAAALAVGRVPGDYTARIDVPLASDLAAGVGLGRLLGRLWQVVAANIAGVVAQVDCEFLHDLRVAIRRTRSLLGQLGQAIPPRDLTMLSRGLSWAGQATGPLRDLDVYLLEFNALESRIPPELAGALLPLREHLEQRQRLAHRELVAVFAGQRWQRVTARWRELARRLEQGQTRFAGARQPLGELAGQRLQRLARRLLRDGRAIEPSSVPEALHELRKRGKKLRYLLELLAPLWNASMARPLVRSIKELQELLGEHQDAVVQAEALLQWCDELAGSAPARTLLAMGVLFEQRCQRQHALRARYAEVFLAFDSAETQQRLTSLTSALEPVSGGSV
jgi:CHAD domain-containing protein